MKRSTALLYGGLVLSAGLLTGCGASSNEEISQWMVEQRNSVTPKVTPIAEPKRFTPQAYSGEASLSPFSSEKLLAALRSEANAGGNSALMKAELNRRKEPLEFVPLDTMRMVGLLDKNGKRVALVRVDKLLYQVGVGNYIGQNFGRITKITDNEITLREVVQDAVGDWVERPVTLQLQEGTGK